MILVALGANLNGPYGVPEKTLNKALSVMEERGISVCFRSSIWKSAPVPLCDQPWYHNSVAVIETDMDALALMECLHQIERDFGRDRNTEERNASRVLDLDLLAYHDLVMDADLILPHPRLHERAFVLYPLREVAENWLHPVTGHSVEQMIADLDKGQSIQRLLSYAA